jgi:hypothetical protein
MEDQLSGSIDKLPAHLHDLILRVQVVAKTADCLQDISGRQGDLTLTAGQGTQHFYPSNSGNDDLMVRLRRSNRLNPSRAEPGSETYRFASALLSRKKALTGVRAPR